MSRREVHPDFMNPTMAESRPAELASSPSYRVVAAITLALTLACFVFLALSFVKGVILMDPAGATRFLGLTEAALFGAAFMWGLLCLCSEG